MRQGSITLYLCIVLSVLLSLVLTGLHSACLAAGRTTLASGMEQGLYSLFAGYDRELYDSFGLLFLEGGYGTESLKPEEMCQEVWDIAEEVVDPEGLLGIHLQEKSMTAYVLATDNQGAAFRRQACQAMEKRLGTSGLQWLSQKLQEGTEVSQTRMTEYEAQNLEELEQEYEQQKESAAAAAEAAEAAEAATEAAGAAAEAATEAAGAATEAAAEGSAGAHEVTGTAVEVPEDFVNPIEVIRQLRTLGILSLVIPDVEDLSSAALDGSEKGLRERQLQQGMGLLPEADTGIQSKLLLLEYLAELFPCYTSQEETEGLRYQVEYAIGGKSTDMENLKCVLDQLLLMREALNFAYLFTNSARHAEADAMALTISTMLLIPAAYELVSLILMACWAFGESMLDLRELLDGGQIPLIKDDASWQLSLTNLAQVTEVMDSERHSSDGLDYQWYLRILLFTGTEEALAQAAMELVEYDMRVQEGQSWFCLDSCVDAAELCLSAQAGKIGKSTFDITRSYGYDMD